MAIARYLADLAGTLRDTFRLGSRTAGTLLKNATGAMQFRNPADSAWADAQAKRLAVHGTNAANGVFLDVPALGASYTLTLPAALPPSARALAVDSAGAAAYLNPQRVEVLAFTQATASPAAVFTPPANASIDTIEVVMDTAASGGAPTLAVGVTGTPGLYMATGECDLREAAIYEVQSNASAGGAPAAVIATITPSAQTFSGRIFIRWTPA